MNTTLTRENEAKNSLLVYEGNVLVPETDEFVVAENFKEDLEPDADVQISYVDYEFERKFGDTIEAPAKPQLLNINRLAENTHDGPILEVIGDAQIVSTRLAKIYHLMKLQGRGQSKGVLDLNSANIFYVPDASGILYAIVLCFVVGAWDINIQEVPRQWHKGLKIFSGKKNFRQTQARTK